VVTDRLRNNQSASEPYIGNFGVLVNKQLRQSLRAPDTNDEWNRGRPASRVFRNIMLISRFYNDAIEETAKEHGLLSGEFVVLMTLMRAGGNTGLRPTELYNELLVTSGAITKRVDRLAEMGLIERVQGVKDRRSSPIKLTKKGLKLGRTIRAEKSKLDVVAGVFGSDKLNDLDQKLHDYLAAIETVSTTEKV